MSSSRVVLILVSAFDHIYVKRRYSKFINYLIIIIIDCEIFKGNIVVAIRFLEYVLVF